MGRPAAAPHQAFGGLAVPRTSSGRTSSRFLGPRGYSNSHFVTFRGAGEINWHLGHRSSPGRGGDGWRCHPHTWVALGSWAERCGHRFSHFLRCQFSGAMWECRLGSGRSRMATAYEYYYSESLWGRRQHAPLDIFGSVRLSEFWPFANSAIVLGTPRVCAGTELARSDAEEGGWRCVGIPVWAAARSEPFCVFLFLCV